MPLDHSSAPRPTATIALSVLLSLVGFAFGSVAEAQLTFTFAAYGTRGTPSASATYFQTLPLSGDECDANTPISISVLNAPWDSTGQNPRSWTLWRGGSGTTTGNCTAGSSRIVTSGSTPACTLVSTFGPELIESATETLSVRPQDLFPDCSIASADLNFFLLAMSGDASTDQSTIATGYYFNFRAVLDGQAPPAPVATDGFGDQAITVSWTPASSSGTLGGASIYVDVAASCAGGDGGVRSSLLVPGEAPPSTINPVRTITGTGTSTTVDPTTLGLELDEGVVGAVAVRDVAGNESVLSNLICLRRVQVSGFWDSYCREQGLSQADCNARYGSCSVSHVGGGGSVPGGLGALGLVLAGLLVRRKRRHRAAPGVVALALGAILASASTAEAQRMEQPVIGEWEYEPIFQPSSENFTLELRGGAYRADLGPSFQRAFGDDLGPLLAIELDGHIFRIPYVGPVAIGARIGWVEWNGTAQTQAGEDAGGTGMSLIPISALAVLRVDVLARELNVPLVLSGKFGVELGYYETGTAGVRQATGLSAGLSYGAQIALELDFLEPRAARRLDEEWGINHAEIFFELFGSTMGSFSDRMLPLGTGLTWSTGLGFTF